MKKKGFTLIELLAVIVILAIIALIATPLILKYIEYSKEKSAKLSANTYAEAVEKEYVSKLTSNEKMDNKEYSISELDVLGVKVKGDKPEGDSDYVILNNGNVIEYVLTINGYVIKYENGKVIVDSNKDSNSNSKKIDALDYTVTFTVDGEPYQIISITKGQDINVPTTPPIKDNIVVTRWIDNSDNEIAFPYTPDGDIQLNGVLSSFEQILYDYYNISKTEYPYVVVEIRESGTVYYSYIYFCNSVTDNGSGAIIVNKAMQYSDNSGNYFQLEETTPYALINYCMNNASSPITATSNIQLMTREGDYILTNAILTGEYKSTIIKL